uniref:Uncharacterized protein n=1 Tax=Peronospora matthiolae TaxID=2874970 RepID=A0AAV1TQB5_9STRA
MPVWTKQEIFDCRELILSGTTEDTVEERYRRWGDNARYVLCDAEDCDQQCFFDMSINDFSLNSLVEARDESGGIENLIFLLLHYRVNDDFSKDGFVFASDHVCEKVYKKLLWHNRGDLMNNFASSRRSSGDHAVLYESLDDA